MKTRAEYLALPWTVHGRWHAEEGGYYLITIEELPGFSVVGDTRLQAEHEFPAVLEEYLRACLDSGHTPPEPVMLAQTA